MAMRFRKSFNLGGGVKLNVGKSGLGISAGSKLGRVSVNTSGRVTSTTSIPGTGIYFQETSSLKKKTKATKKATEVYKNDFDFDNDFDDDPDISYKKLDYSLLSKQEIFRALNINIKCADFEDDSHCTVCGKKKTLFVKLTPHGFCENCNLEVRKAIWDNKKTIDTYVNCIYRYGAGNVGRSLIVSALNKIDQLEAIRPYAPFFTSSLDEQRKVLENAL